MDDGSPIAEGLAQAQAEALAAMAPDTQAAFRQAAARFEALTPAEQQAALDAAHDEQRAHQADQIVEAVLDAIRHGRTVAIVPRLTEAAADLSTGDSGSSPSAGLAQFIGAVAGLLQGRPAPPVPPEFATHLAAISAALRDTA